MSILWDKSAHLRNLPSIEVRSNRDVRQDKACTSRHQTQARRRTLRATIRVTASLWCVNANERPVQESEVRQRYFWKLLHVEGLHDALLRRQLLTTSVRMKARRSRNASQNEDHMQGSAMVDQSMVTIRNEALSLLKLKMRHNKARKQPRSQQQMSDEEIHIAIEGNSEVNYAIERLQSRLGDPPLVGERVQASQSIPQVTNLKLGKRRIEFNCAQRSSNQRDKEEELTIAQLLQKTVVFEAASTRKCNERDEGIARDAPILAAASADALQTQIMRDAMNGAEFGPRCKAAKQNLKKRVVKWSCRTCKRECIPIRKESRCLCLHAHRRNAHAHRFSTWSQKARGFYAVVASTNILIMTQAASRSTARNRNAVALDSTDHEQEIVEKEFRSLQLLQEQCEIEELNVVHRIDLFAEPLRV
ncbi:hypothetical protein FI667_g11037, partial [Globisporangium splendens]